MYVTNNDSLDGGNGNAANIDEFLRNKLATFITSTSLFAGGDHWTRSKSDVNFATNEYEVFLTPPANLVTDETLPPYMAFHTEVDSLYMFPGSGFDTNTPAYDQPGGPACWPPVSGGAPVWDITNNGTQCPTVGGALPNNFLGHHLFASNDGRYCYAVINVGTRRWRHFWFGNFNKFGGQASFDGGEFVSSGYWNQNAATIDNPYVAGNANTDHYYPGRSINGGGSTQSLRSNVFRAAGIQQGASATWFALGGTTTALNPGCGTRPSGASYSNVNQTSGAKTVGGGTMTGPGPSLGLLLWKMSASVLSNAKPLIPIYVGISSQIDALTRVVPIGQIPDVYRINMKGFTAGQTITIGSFNYVVFPLTNHDEVNTLANEEYSGYEGYAYRIIPNP